MTGITTAVRGPSAVRPKVAVGDAASKKRNSLLGALVLLAAVQLMVVLDTTIVNVALPSIQRGLGFSIGGIAWVVNGYALTFGALLLLGGRSGDMLGRRNVFIGSLAVFALASTLGGLASGPAMLVAGRVLQGVAAAFAQATALSLIVSTFPAGAARNRAVGVFAAMEGLGAAAGLLLGGVLVNSLGWRWVFFVNVPVAVVVAALAPRFIPVAARRSARFDLRGAASATVGLGLLVFGLSRAAEHGWADITTSGPIAIGVLGLLIFVRIEARSAQPLMSLWVFADRNRGGAYLIQALVAMIAAAGAVSQIVTRIGVRPLVAAGTATAALGMFLLGNLNAHSTYLGGVLPPLIILSAGLGLTFVPATLAAVSGVSEKHSGLVSGVSTTAIQIGGAIGLAVLATIAATTTRNQAAGTATTDALSAGYTRAFQVGAVIIALAVPIALALLRLRPTTDTPQDESDRGEEDAR